MVGQSSWVKTALGLGAMSLGAIATTWLANTAPAFSQAAVLDQFIEQTELSKTTTQPVVVNQAVTEDATAERAVDAAESGAAMLTLTEALAADGVTDVFVSAEAEALKAPAKKQPGAEALSGLESASIESFAVNTAGRDLVATGAAFTVDAASVPALQAALHSDRALTQLYAADALWTLTGDRNLVLPTLMEAANSDDPDIQELAVLALRQMGDEASPAVPVLIELLDKDSKTRLIAQDALTVINSESRSEAVLGIIARESQRRLLPAALRAITGLWR